MDIKTLTYGSRGKDGHKISTQILPPIAQAIAYVQNQREHHRTNSLNPYLETLDHNDDGPAAWNHGEAIAGVEPL